MPVPVSVTHSSRAPTVANSNAELPTEGPFARLASKSRVNDGSDGQISQAGVPGSQGQRSLSSPATACGYDPSFNHAEKNVHPRHTALDTNNLSFWYSDIDGRPLADRPPVVQNMSISLPQGATCLLVGPNGAGKTTLLKVLGGKHMVDRNAVSILGEPPFHATHLISDGSLSYIGGNWERDVAFAGYSIPLAGDISASRMLHSLPNTDPLRLSRLIEVLDIDPSWRMHLVSDGQRRRVQIAMGLLKPFKVLLLDEITVDLDVLGRADLMDFLKEECKERNATVIYATHIFDGLESWPSHLLYVAGGRVREFKRAEDIPELRQGRLLSLVEKWLRDEKEERMAGSDREGTGGMCMEYSGDKGSDVGHTAQWNNGWVGGRLTSSIKLSSNAVMRM